MTDGRVRRVGRWRVTLSVTLLLVGVGVLFARPAFVFAGIVPLVYLAGSQFTGVSDVDVDVTRSLSDRRPLPGDEVTVTVTVENVGERPLTDVRLVDGVPDQLEVVSGSPRTCTGLRSGDAETYEYAVVARRGDHEFSDAEIRVRSLSASSVFTGSASVVGDAELRCELALEDVPVREQTVQYVGQVPVDVAGSGTEFHSTREYRPSDPISRINWRRYAETGELSTVQYREPRSATVVLVLDARPTANQSVSPGQPTALEYGLYAADRAISALRDSGNSVGITAIGSESEFVEPGRTDEVAARYDDLAASIADAQDDTRAVGDGGAVQTASPRRDRQRAGHGADADVDASARARDICKRLPANAQVLFVSPVLDSPPLEATETFRAYGHEVTLLSPNVAGSESIGQRLERVRRELRLARIRERGAGVVDWDVDDPLSIAVADALERWIDR